MGADDTLTFDTVKSSEGESCDDLTGSDSGDDYSDDSASGDSGSSAGGSDSSGGSQQAPTGATARCDDGTYSYSAHPRGTCSHHGGVAVWLASVPS
ncbi:DUF3761 domain-containing protein [Streptomyces sp. NPDC048636]|uniref:DUF3761 domain-containing protein n=1 Tax=Streptomyces sp. NPDC048636 TaxID=3155762 RepID=UPI0034385AF1